MGKQYDQLMNRRNALKKTGWFAGAALATPSLLSLLQSCKTEERSEWQPEFFSEEEAATVSAMVDTLLPRTQTPGALDVGVHVFLDKLAAQSYDEAGQQALRDDIAQFNAKCIEKYGERFEALGQEAREEIFSEAEKSNPKFNPGVWGKTIGEQEPVDFYRSLKGMAIWAYTTSQEIGENVLNYDPIPGKYVSCVPVSEVGNKWSL